MLEDRRLILSLQRGDRDGLRLIYENYKDELITIAACLVGDRATAEDCLQDVFVRLASNAGKIRIRSSLRGYLITSVANRARDKLRKRKRPDVPLSEVAEPVGNTLDPAERIADRERTADLLEALGKLPYEQREAITLHLRGKLTFREIADRQGVSINTAQSRYRYGIDKLRKLLN